MWGSSRPERSDVDSDDLGASVEEADREREEAEMMEQMELMKKAAYDACLAEVKAHLTVFLSKQPRGSYEEWIAELHPENLRSTTTSGAPQIDYRFYVEGSDHRRLWNSRVDMFRNVPASKAPGSPMPRQGVQDFGYAPGVPTPGLLHLPMVPPLFGAVAAPRPAPMWLYADAAPPAMPYRPPEAVNVSSYGYMPHAVYKGDVSGSPMLVGGHSYVPPTRTPVMLPRDARGGHHVLSSSTRGSRMPVPAPCLAAPPGPAWPSGSSAAGQRVQWVPQLPPAPLLSWAPPVLHGHQPMYQVPAAMQPLHHGSPAAIQTVTPMMLPTAHYGPTVPYAGLGPCSNHAAPSAGSYLPPPMPEGIASFARTGSKRP